ncbi:OTU domain-containing protein [Trichostrongylus colubriformis]|uniref:ubiquitinyl hydrolase 1 n=1 Tax=Trichostrongylus colubriformis TaxID=6319 RepID=A0AAN8III0_TRICO
MGRIFIENHGGLRVVVCRFCKTYLTNRSELISSRFQGSSGRAMLFHRAWNLDYSEAQHRDMMTGKHIVRDVMCRVCHKKVGWMYEFAMEESQRYKEARVILEKALIDEEDGFPDPAGALETHEQPPSYLEADFARLLKRTRGFDIRVVRGDGSCMFRAVADQLYADQDMHGEVRRLCMDYMERNRDHFAPFVAENFSSYVARKRQPGQHGNHVELQAISEMFARPIEIYEYSENPRNVFYPTIRSLDVNVPIRLSYHGSSHYNSVVDPFAPTAGIGLGLPDFYPRGVNNLRDTIKESEDRSVEQAILESQLALTDIERTEKEINEQIARDSYMEYLRMLMDSSDSACGSNTKESGGDGAKGYTEVPGGMARLPSKSTLYEELLALEGFGPCPATAEEEEDALARALLLSEQQYLEELQYRYGSGSDGHSIN